MLLWNLECVYLFKLFFVGSHGTFVFRFFLRKLHAIFYSACTNSHSYQECTSVPFFSTSDICYLWSFLFFPFWSPWGTWKFLDQGSSKPQLQPTLQMWQCWILNTLCWGLNQCPSTPKTLPVPLYHSGNSYLWSFDNSYSDRCEVTLQCGFALHFSDDWWCWASFPVPVGHLHVTFGKNTYSGLLPIFNQIVYFFDVEL